MQARAAGRGVARGWVRGAGLILTGDCLEVMRTLDACSVDAVVTDPPYGIGFMGKAWDGKDITARLEKRRSCASQHPTTGRNGGHHSAAAAAGAYDLSPQAMVAFQQFTADWCREAFRVMKPGAYLVSFASPRTYHRMACGIEEAGFELRDQIMWLFGSGFPKSHNGEWGGTALKPAHEPIALARKPLIGTVEANWRQHGTGALNIEACRIDGVKPDTSDCRGAIPCRHDSDTPRAPRGRDGEASAERRYSEQGGTDFAATPGQRGGDPSGRWPANIVHDGSDEVLAAFPYAPGQQRAVGPANGAKPSVNTFGDFGPRDQFNPRGDSGSAARFFYCAKASKEDRNDGLDAFQDRLFGMSAAAAAAAARGEHYDNGDGGVNRVTARKNHHPTVKPTELMRWLCRLVAPPGGVVLDPFAGSGSTGRGAIAEGMQFIGIELDADYASIADARIRAVQPGLALGSPT